MDVEYLMIFASLLGVIGLIFLTYYASRWLNKKFNFGSTYGAKSSIKIVEYTTVAQDKQLIIVSVGGKYMLLGVTPGSISKICDLDDYEIPIDESSKSDESSFMANFKRAFAENTHKKNNNDSMAEDIYNEKDGQN